MYLSDLLHTGVPEKIRGQNRLAYKAINLTAVNLTWGKPFDRNSPITSYIVMCDNCPTTSSAVDANVTELVISGLTPGVEYAVNVVAVNNIGEGPDSNTVMASSATQSIAKIYHITTSIICTVLSYA